MNTISSMLGRKVLRLCLLSILWVGIAALLGFRSPMHAQCTDQIGYGTNHICQQGATCGSVTCAGTTVTYWCITETCTQNLTCTGPDQNKDCIALGCNNPAQGNCNACPGS